MNEQGEIIGLGVYPYDNKNKVLLKPEFLDKKKTIPSVNFNQNDVVTRYDGERLRILKMTRCIGDYTGPYTIQDNKEDTIARRVLMDGAFYRGVGTLVNHADEAHANLIFGMVNKHNAITNNMNEKTRGIIATNTIRASGAKTIKKLLMTTIMSR